VEDHVKYSFCVVTAAWLVACPVGGAAAQGSNAAPSGQVTYRIVCQTEPGPLGGRLRGRLRDFLGLPPRVGTVQAVRVMPATPTAEPPLGAQPPYTAYHQGSVTPATAVNLQATSLPIAPKYQDKVGHETDYTWVTGHLFYVHADGGKWVVRYAAPDEVDRHGGSIVLTPTVEMRNFREGDLVNVYGEILDNGQAARPLGAALYRVKSIQMVERADP
jgi:hypothetical protein